jgi:hypothetical protein
MNSSERTLPLAGENVDVDAAWKSISRAAVLMLSAHSEGYVEDIFEGALHAVHARLEPAEPVERLHYR